MRIAPDLCADPSPEPVVPDTAWLLAPLEPIDQQAMQDYLNWVADLHAWGKGLSDRAEKTAKSSACTG